MKSVFSTKAAKVIMLLTVGYIGVKSFLNYGDYIRNRDQEALIERLNGTDTMTLEDCDCKVLTPEQFDMVVKVLTDVALPLVLGGGGIASRALGDKSIYTPRGFPGQDRIEEVIIEGDDIFIN